MNGRERITARLARRPADHIPVMPITMMFAANQSGVKYRDYVTDHRVLVDAQLRVAERFGFDYVSVISDPAREAHDLGARIEFFDDQPPALAEDHALLGDKATLLTLKIPEPCNGPRMSDRIAGVQLLRQRAGSDLLVEGWVEGPCAEAADLRGINALMLDFYDDPAFVHDLFEFAVKMNLKFAKRQIAAGADIIGIGDAAASLVGPKIYNEFVWDAECQLIEGIHALGGLVRLHICGNAKRILERMGQTRADLIDIDFPVPMPAARAAMPNAVLLGNLEPAGTLRSGTPDQVAGLIAQCHADAGEYYIAGAGCEICRDTPDANVLALTDYARTHV
ncbi:MAG: uroporphyrinogen decarboxylase family protein [Bryobacteraceae bacterium]|nr:uroporphyrinogen decarboxylase family protein [Bryobacteraceae bacterium]